RGRLGLTAVLSARTPATGGGCRCPGTRRLLRAPVGPRREGEVMAAEALHERVERRAISRGSRRRLPLSRLAELVVGLRVEDVVRQVAAHGPAPSDPEGDRGPRGF